MNSEETQSIITFLTIMIKILERTTKGRDLFWFMVTDVLFCTALKTARQDRNQSELRARARADTLPKSHICDLLPASSHFLSFPQPPQIAQPDEIQGFKHISL